MHLAERQNHLANELALWRRQLKEQLPDIVAQGRKEAEKILEGI